MGTVVVPVQHGIVRTPVSFNGVAQPGTRVRRPVPTLRVLPSLGCRDGVRPTHARGNGTGHDSDRFARCRASVRRDANDLETWEIGDRHDPLTWALIPA